MIDNIWLLTVHLCPVGPRVLDTCSLIYRAIHIRGIMGPPEPELDSFLFLGATNSFEVLFTILYLCHALLLYLRLCMEHLYCLGSWHDSAVSTSPTTLSGSQSFTAVPTTLSPSRSRLALLRVYIKGWPPEIFPNPVIALS